jgi:hypothetical protein
MLPTSSAGDRKQLLHCVRSDGLPVTRFQAVFTHCTSCDRIMTKSAASYHDCVRDRSRSRWTAE